MSTSQAGTFRKAFSRLIDKGYETDYFRKVVGHKGQNALIELRENSKNADATYISHHENMTLLVYKPPIELSETYVKAFQNFSDGRVSKLEMQLSPSTVPPKKTDIIGDINGEMTVTRTFDTLSGEKSLRQVISYQGKSKAEINDGFRILHEVEKTTPQGSVKVVNPKPKSFSDKLNFEIKTVNEEGNAITKTFSVDLKYPKGEKPQILDFYTNNDATSLTFYTHRIDKNGKSIINEQTADIAHGKKGVEVKFKPKSELSKKEVEELGIKAVYENHAPRVADKPQIRPQRSNDSSGKTN